MKYRYRISMEVIVEAKTPEKAEEKFGNVSLGELDNEQKTKNIVSWDYIETDNVCIVERDGTLTEI